MPNDAQLPWTDEQWATVQRTVQDTARKARVAASFLPLVGPLPDGQASVPALPMSQQQLDGHRGEASERLEVDDGQTLRLTTIACEVYLKTQQAEDPKLSAAYQMLGRAADVIGRLEDAIVFNGQPNQNEAPQIDGHPIQPAIYTVRNGQRHDGLVTGPPDVVVEWAGAKTGYSENLVGAVVGAVAALEGNGHYGPFACVLGHELYRAANTPNRNSLVLPSDRIVPFLDGGPLRRSSVVPKDLGVIVALAGSPIDLVVASDVHVRFLQLSVEPRYVLRVSERFALRIKQPKALFLLKAGAQE
jgi:uncharacterized linocin/CFP29 family protein